MEDTSKSGKEHVEYIDHALVKDLHRNDAAQIHNPLHGLSRDDLDSQVYSFCSKYGFDDKVETFRKAALVAQHPEAFETMPELSDDDKYWLRRETTRE